MKLINEQLIKKWEKLRLVAYLPTPNDKWTIGWGHTYKVKPGMKITEAQAEKFFDEDTAWAQKAVNQLVTVGLTQHQFDALVSFVFNVGERAFRTSTLLRKLNAGDYQGAAEQFPRWNKQAGKVLRGLVRRRAEEMEYFLTPDIKDGPSYSRPEIPTSDILKPLLKSKEMLTGVGAAVTGLIGALGTLTPELQNSLSTGLILALIAFGGFIVWNRLQARKKGDR